MPSRRPVADPDPNPEDEYDRSLRGVICTCDLGQHRDRIVDKEHQTHEQMAGSKRGAETTSRIGLREQRRQDTLYAWFRWSSDPNESAASRRPKVDLGCGGAHSGHMRAGGDQAAVGVRWRIVSTRAEVHVSVLVEYPYDGEEVPFTKRL